jgi:hypothetical protein
MVVAAFGVALMVTVRAASSTRCAVLFVPGATWPNEEGELASGNGLGGRRDAPQALDCLVPAGGTIR